MKVERARHPELFHKRLPDLIKKVLLVTVLLTPRLVSAEAAPVRTVDATGFASVRGAQTALARDGAIDDALRKAVEQVVGTVVSAETMVENYQVLSDKVYTRTEGYIKNYTVLNEARTRDLYQVTVRATVAVGDIKNDLDAIGILYARAGRPRVLFMIAEQNIGQKHYSFWWSGPEFKGESFAMSVVESYLKEAFLSRGFNVVDISGSTGTIEVSDIFRVVDLGLEGARRIGTELNAEVVVKGRAIARAGLRTPGSQVGSYLADVTVEAIRVDTGEVLASAFAHGRARHISEITGGSEALRSASAELADRLVDQMLAKWSVPSTIFVRLGGIVDYRVAADFKEALKMRVRGVSAVYQRGLEGAEAVFEIESRVPASSIADELSRLPGWSLNVTRTTPNTIEVYIEEASD
jgi:hypothetical protein